VNSQTGPVLMFVNAEAQQLSGDTVQDIQMFWDDYGFDEENWSRVQIVDKGYAFLRAWMDEGISPAGIIKTLRLMYQSRINDSRRLFGGENSDTYEQGFRDFLGNDFQDFVLYDPLITPDISIAQLKKFSGAYLVGGGRDQCLREVEIVMNAFNIKYKRIDALIY
jgi:hypothetical protein